MSFSVIQIADKLDKHPAVVALAWGLKHGTSVIPKVRETIASEKKSTLSQRLPAELSIHRSDLLVDLLWPDSVGLP